MVPRYCERLDVPLSFWAISLFTRHLGIGKKSYKHECKLSQQHICWSPGNEVRN